MEKKPKVAIVFGTRAELIKLAPLIKEAEQRKWKVFLLHSGQHYIDDLLKDFDIRKPDIRFFNVRSKISKGKTINALKFGLGFTFKFRKWLKENSDKIDYVIYQGDTITTACAAIASNIFINKSYKTVHIEAGLRSGNIFEPFPEELCRIVADRLSDILFAVSEKTKEFLIQKYGKKKEIFNSSNTLIDSLKFFLEKSKSKKINKNNFTVVTIHRLENIKNKNRLKNIVNILNNIDLPVLFFINENTEKMLKKYNLYNRINKEKVKIVKTLPYSRFLPYLLKSNLVITDSGGLQLECFVLGKKCVILRKCVEYKEFIDGKNQIIVDPSKENNIKHIIKKMLSSKKRLKKGNNLLKKEEPSKFIIKKLEELVNYGKKKD